MKLDLRGNLLRVLPFFLCGLAFIVLTPPFQAPDEPEHFARLTQISQGDLLGTLVYKNSQGGGIIPNVFIETAGLFWHLHHNGDAKLKPSQLVKAMSESKPLDDTALKDRREISISSYSLISPIPYVPQATAAFIGKLFSVRPLAIMYMARLANLIFGMFLFALALAAVEFSPRLQLAVFITAGIPMCLFLSATTSGNGNVNGYALCVVAFGALLRQKYTKERFIAFLIFAGLISLSKSVYFMLPLALLPTVWAQAKSSKDRWRRVGALVAAAFIPGAIWSIAAKGLYSPLRVGVDPVGAVVYALRNPGTMFQVLVHTMKANYTFYKETFIGRVGYHDVGIPYLMVKIYFYALFAVAFVRPKQGIEIFPTRKQSAWILAIALSAVLITFATIVMTWNPVGTKLIEGVQGRHFLPVFPLLFLAAVPLIKLKPSHWKMWRSGLLAAWGVAISINLYCTATRYWIF